jgi:hypothetical protein
VHCPELGHQVLASIAVCLHSSDVHIVLSAVEHAPTIYDATPRGGAGLIAALVHASTAHGVDVRPAIRAILGTAQLAP